MSTPEDDRRLRARVRAGDEDAFAELYERHDRAILAHAYRLTASWQTAEDVTAETFLAAWRGRDRLRQDDSSLTPWLYGIATNQALNATRSARRRRAFLSRAPRPADEPDFADDASARIDAHRAVAQAQRLLEQLRRPDAEVLALVTWAGLSYEETAAVLSIPVGTVRSRLSRGRARLRTLLGEPDEADESERPARSSLLEGLS